MFKFCYYMFFSALIIFSCEATVAKEEMWEAMAEDVDYWVDGIGFRVDPGIKETVIALNLMGIITTASCEGHMDHGSAYPWVGLKLSSPETEKLTEELSEIGNQRINEEELLKEKYPYLSDNALLHMPEANHLVELHEIYYNLRNLAQQAKMHCILRINRLLNEFYENRTVIYDRMLIVSRDNFDRLHSIGADLQVIRTEDEQKQKLEEYKNEMQAFAVFLKKKFFQE